MSVSNRIVGTIEIVRNLGEISLYSRAGRIWDVQIFLTVKVEALYWNIEESCHTNSCAPLDTIHPRRNYYAKIKIYIFFCRIYYRKGN